MYKPFQVSIISTQYEVGYDEPIRQSDFALINACCGMFHPPRGTIGIIRPEHHGSAFKISVAIHQMNIDREADHANRHRRHDA